MKELIQKLRAEGLKVTIHDASGDANRANFVLAVAIEEPLDIWYVALVMKESCAIPKIEGFLLYFPEINIDAEAYEYICA